MGWAAGRITPDAAEECFTGKVWSLVPESASCAAADASIDGALRPRPGGEASQRDEAVTTHLGTSFLRRSTP